MNKSENPKGNKTELLTFNKAIKVEIEIDEIARKLCSEFPDEYKHKELVTNVIIGNLLNSTGVGMNQLYNALNGYTNDVDFQVGDVVESEEIYSTYVMENDKPVRRNEKLNGEVVRVDVFRSDKLLIKYSCHNSEMKLIESENWLNHRKCTRVAKTLPTND